MAHVQTLLRVDMDPTKPVLEILAAIQAMVNLNPDKELEILKGVAEGLERRMNQLKGANLNAEPVLRTDAIKKDK